jgi:hypothetical protein
MIDETRKTLFMGEIKTISCSKAVELLFNVFSQEEGTARCGRRELFFSINTPSGTLCRSPDGSRGETTENDYSK